MARWFRLYSEVVNDPKVQKLPCEDFRAWVNLLCLASENDGKLPPIEDVAFALRMTLDGARTVVERLSSGGLIDRVSGGADGYHYAPHGWAKRQYKSDTSTERVKRFRQRSETVSETPPETETDTEQRVTKVTHIRASDQFDAFWSAYPVKKGKKPAHAAYLKALKETDHGTLVAAVSAQRRWPEWADPGYIPHAATWLNRGGWTDEPRGSASPHVAGQQNTSSGGRGDTSFADIAARRRREREAGMEIPGGSTGLHGGHNGWRDGAITGEYSAGDCQAGSGHDAADTRNGGTDGFAVAASFGQAFIK